MDRVELRTERLLLRQFRVSDVDDLLKYANDPEWVRYLVNIPHPYTRKDAETFVSLFSNPANWEALQIFAIVLEDKVIGEIYLNQRDSDR